MPSDTAEKRIQFLWGKKMNPSAEVYPGHLTKAVCLGGWIVSTVRRRVGSILLPKSGAAPATTTRRRRRCATGAAVKVGK